MPAKNHLSPEQKQYLQQNLKWEENGNIRERILILLLGNDGKTQREIAEFLGCSLNKVCYWCVHGDPDNLDSLKDERMKGNHKKATDEYINILLETVEKDPQELGYEFGRWTGQRLAVHLETMTGIQLSGSQIRRLLKQKKYVHLWAKYSLESKRNPEKRKVFYQKLQEYFKIEKDTPERLQVWFWDESGFSLRVIRRKTWCQRGTRKKVRGDRRKGRVNVMGGIRNSDKKRFVDFLSSNSNAENFYQVIRLFYDEIKNEWCQTGGQREKFAEQGPKIVVILDNATFHKKPDWLQKIATHMPNIHLEFLPEYSPDLNIIELVWHAAKEYLANRVFTFIEELEQLLHKLLNEGELIIHWGRKLKNKGNAVVAI